MIILFLSEITYCLCFFGNLINLLKLCAPGYNEADFQPISFLKNIFIVCIISLRYILI